VDFSFVCPGRYLTIEFTSLASADTEQRAAYYNDFRWQRQPSEALSIGRNFRIAGEDKVVLNIRAEFQNVFNRLFFSTPSAVNPSAPVTRTIGTNLLTGGYGWVNYINGAGSRPRTGQIVARLTF
jgi:hypothetical protein